MVRTVGLTDYSDVHYTSDGVARQIVAHFNPRGVCLEPFRGGGAFHRHLPPGSPWCEIEEGRDFFAWREPVDWIVTNPPFSNLTAIFAHAFELAEQCVFLMPVSKYWSSAPRIRLAQSYGGLKEIMHLGTGRDIGFDIGFPFAAMHFVRKYRGPITDSGFPAGTLPAEMSWPGERGADSGTAGRGQISR
jgi:hypothetical protein